MATISKKIGTFQADIWKGQIPVAQRQSTLVDRAGVDGTGVVFGAWRCGPVTIQTINDLVTGTFDTYQEAVRRLIGTHVTVYDGFGNRWETVLVVNAVIERFAAQAGGTNRLMFVTWTLLPTSAEP
jgi:hypothetical protein